MSKTPTLDSLEQEMTKRRTSLLYQLWEFLGQNKKWWMIPILLVLLLFGVLMLLGSSAAAPFIYSLF
jgi:uncharacterized protein DUF5989